MKKLIVTALFLFLYEIKGWAQSDWQTIELASCQNGIQVNLKTKYVGSCQNSNGETGYFYWYVFEMRNRTAQIANYNDFRPTINSRNYPKDFLCMEESVIRKSGESITFGLNASHLNPFEVKKISEVVFVYTNQSGHNNLVREAEAIFKSLCDKTYSSSNIRSGSYSSAQKETDALRKQGKYEEARQVWERYKDTHPEDAKRAEQQQLKIIKELGQKNDREQKAREKAEVAAGAAEVGLMTYLGGFIYNGAGKDKPKNVQTSNSWRFNFTMGYSFALMPTYTNSEYSSYIGTQPYENLTVEKGSVATLNFDLGLQFWPYYGKNAGVGVIANGFGGYMPLPGSNASYNYNYGGQVYFGLPSIKLTGIYLMGDRGFDKLYKFTSSIGSSTSIDTGNGAAAFSRLMVGPRISFGQDEFKTKHLELFYVMENYTNMKLIKSSGVNVTYYAHNRIKIYGEYLFNAARIGTVKDGFTLADDLSNNGSLILFGVVRTIDVFAH